MCANINSSELKELLMKCCAVTCVGDDEIRRATKSDGEIARLAAKELNIHVSESYIRRLRLELDIFPVPRGGPRPGAGRPKGSPNKRRNTKREYRKHKLTISDHALVQACSSAYNFEPGRWNQWIRKYEKLPRYVPKFTQDGLKSYTPIIPFPDCYSKTQKYSSLKGQ